MFVAAGAVMCELCDRLFYEQVDYKHHFKRCHLGQFNIRCDACGKGFWKTKALREHCCYPEMRDENERLQRGREEEALRKRSEVRAAMGLGDGVGIDVVDVVEMPRATHDDPGPLPRAVDNPEAEAAVFDVDAGDVVPLRDTSCVVPLQDQSGSETDAVVVPDTENGHSNACAESETNSLPSHGYGTRRKRACFRKLLPSN